ncbi:tetratricopeptide repeat protein [Thiohalomonas denitrificans]|uniref:Sel1 repeat-containing protein n=1 Tax=Thiohalomonas denitrificans TaxID=415747 RepID=A0A1G5PT88_9GAMM|nr:SEL1-like repeat protein [Thiohalomonas denitrificans]SCZ52289.1 Sel1 repeat-containing protein [Thiohalomonas denitrificans]
MSGPVGGSEAKLRYCEAGKIENRPALAACFRTGECEEAIKIQLQRTEVGDGAESLLLGELYMRTGEIQKAGERLGAAAKSGCIEAMMVYAQLLRDGKGVDKNPEQAAHWFGEAAKAGAGTAAKLLGSLYRNGEGVARDKAKALDWFLIGECLKSRSVNRSDAADYEFCLETVESEK